MQGEEEKHALANAEASTKIEDEKYTNKTLLLVLEIIKKDTDRTFLSTLVKIIEKRNNTEYYYENKVILKNALAEMDLNTLKRIEPILVTYKTYLLHLPYCDDDKYRNEWVKIKYGKFDSKHFLTLHEYLFGEIYDFGGRLRTESTNDLFCRPQFILENLEQTFYEMVNIIEKVDTKKELVKFIAKYFGELNTIHPFEIGNDLCVREFLKEFVEHFTDYRIEYYNLFKNDSLYKEFRVVCFESIMFKYDKLIQIFDDIITKK